MFRATNEVRGKYSVHALRPFALEENSDVRAQQRLFTAGSDANAQVAYALFDLGI